jgi:hypothetical protein
MLAVALWRCPDLLTCVAAVKWPGSGRPLASFTAMAPSQVTEVSYRIWRGRYRTSACCSSASPKRGTPVSAIAEEGRWSPTSPVIYGYIREARRWNQYPDISL